MASYDRNRAGKAELPPPPPLPKGATPELVVADETAAPKRLPMARRALGSRGQAIQLLTNHFPVRMPPTDGIFFHYSVKVSYEDGHPAEVRGIGRKIMDKVYETYESELKGKQFAYDGEKALFTLGPLPSQKHVFTVVVEDQPSGRSAGRGSPGSSDIGGSKRLKRPARSKTYKVEISYASKIPLQAISNALMGQESDQFQDAVRVLDIMLRQIDERNGGTLFRRSFIPRDPGPYNEIGGGVLAYPGFHSSFRATQSGLSLNMDVSKTMIVQPGPVKNFLLANQNVRDLRNIDWNKAKRTLKNLRIKAVTSNMEFKITGLSEKSCREQTFELRQRNGDGDRSTEISVYDYFVKYRNMDLRESADYQCINVGKPKRPSYLPLEVCELVPLQRYTKSLTSLQRASLVEKSRQRPQERKGALTNAIRRSDYGSDPLLRSTGIAINPQFAGVKGRILAAPELRVGNCQGFLPRGGRWNFNNKTLFEPTTQLKKWIIVNFSARVDTNALASDIVKCGERKGMRVFPPYHMKFEEPPQNRRASAPERVEMMIAYVKSKLPEPPEFILCVLAERKTSGIYGPWKRKCLAELGVVTQCIAPTKLNDQYLTNVLLKINAKLGGLNSVLSAEQFQSIPLVSKVPTLIIGMDVSHGSPGRADVPSIAAVVSSRGWPLISRYQAAVRTQSPKVEIIDGLFKPVPGIDNDEGMIRELLDDFIRASPRNIKPEHIVIFRDGVSESQFIQVMNMELDQIIKACEFKDESWHPKFTLIVCQKNHHTRFFLANNSPDNVPPGTVIDNTICHPKNNDFYMCAHAGMIGTTRPTHYHVLHDEIGFTADDLQQLVHSLSYVYQRSTTAISIVAPICYAHLAAAQVGQFIKFDDFSETSSSQGGVTSAGRIPVPELPRLHPDVKSTMFFC